MANVVDLAICVIAMFWPVLLVLGILIFVALVLLLCDVLFKTHIGRRFVRWLLSM